MGTAFFFVSADSFKNVSTTPRDLVAFCISGEVVQACFTVGGIATYNMA